MTIYGFHASHEQIPPAQLLRDVQHAERAGFDAAMCSDHLSPWNHAQGHSGFSWSWLGAALATTELRMGVVVAPGQRYHPVVVAHAMATLEAMFPGRFWAALGSGEAMNEHVTGDAWPRKEVRDARLAECVDVIRRLHAGQEVTHDGLVQVDRARLWSLPDDPPPIIVPALSPATAARGAAWADGLVTVNAPRETLQEIIAAYRDAGGRGPVTLQVHLSWDPDLATAERIAHEQWRTNVFSSPLLADLETVEQFEDAAQHVQPEDVHGSVRISADLDQHVQWLREDAETGFDEVYLHHVGQEQAGFIDAFGEHVLPALRGEVGR